MEYKPADPEELREILENYESVLAERIRRDEVYYASKKCPECGAPVYPIVDDKHPFGGEITPKCLLHCTYCSCVFEPDTGIILKFGEAYEPMATPADLWINEPEDLPES